mmetsp:Transcript_17246/g.28943  ORF Transcript_17246/g.28943 Transcript_17246/m.28943 type:complete len:573 (-) Transcript_17246:326-2044(-)
MTFLPHCMHKWMNILESQTTLRPFFSLLYTVYSVPNVILPFFGGYFTDKFGSRVCLIVFAGFITAGQFIFALGLSMKSWPLMYLGRVVFGIGGESMGVANSAILSVWFKGKELALAFGLNLSIARLGSVINNVVSPTLADSIGIEFAFWFGVILCASSVCSAMFIAYFDLSMDNYLIENKGAHSSILGIDDEDEAEAVRREKAQESLNQGLLGPGEEDASAKAEEKVEPQFKDVLTFNQVYWIVTIICVVVYGCVLPFNNIASTLLLERDYFMEPPSECHLLDGTQCQSDANYPVDCPSSKWYQPPLPTNVTLSDGSHYEPLTADDIDCTDDFWSDGCAEEFCSRQTDAELQAGTIMSIPYIISACLSPVLGGFVDRFGLRAIIATIAPMMLVVVHSLLGYTDVDPVGPLVGQGLAYAGFAAVIWPSVPLIVPARLVGLAYGVAFSIQNAGLASFPLIIAAVYEDNGDKYIPAVETFFVLVAATGVLVGFYLNFYDFFYIDSILNSADNSKTVGENGSSRKSGEMSNPIHGEEKERLIGSNVAKFNDDDDDSDDGRQSGSRARSSELYANLH